MRLHAESLDLVLSPSRAVDTEDWVRVLANANTGAFSGTFDAYLQLEDLRRFERELREMHAGVGNLHEAVLSCIEPGIYLRLASKRLGGVEGTYRLEPERSPEQATLLSGQFLVDQSYLPELAASIDALIVALENKDF
jgi:hypothetical protein